MDIPAWALDDRDLWTPQLVADALVHALRVERAMPSRIAPAPLRALSLETDGAGDEWPEEIERFVPTKDDITHCECVRVGFRDEQGRKHPAWLNGVVLRPRSRNIAGDAEAEARVRRRHRGEIAQRCRAPRLAHRRPAKAQEPIGGVGCQPIENAAPRSSYARQSLSRA
jgi:hypothetical protein